MSYEDFEDQEEELYDDESDMIDEEEEAELENRHGAELPDIKNEIPENAEVPLTDNKPISEVDAMSYKAYITFLYDEFCNMHKGVAGLEDEWSKVRAQVNSALQLHIPRSSITPLISLEYSYEQREVIKYMLFTGASGEVVEQMTPNLSYKEMIARYDASKVESAVANMLDAPLNTMSKLVNDYKEDLSHFRQETEQQIADYEQQIKEKTAELETVKNELKSLKEAIEEENKKQQQEQQIKAEAEKLAQSMFLEQKKQFEAENRHNQEVEELYMRIQQLENGVTTSSNSKEKKRFSFKKKQDKSSTPPPKRFDNVPLPKDFDISTYMMQSNLASSQLDVIALAVKCGLSDRIVKDMIDSGKDARQLKQIVEVFLAKRDREMKEKTAKEHVISQEDIIYDE